MSKMNEAYFELITDYINSYREDNGISPTSAEIEKATGIPRSTLSRYLQYMKANGMLSITGRRGYVTSKIKKTREETINVPVAGNVSCGLPKYAEENIEEYIRLPVALFGSGKFFILRADGDSMIDAGIDIGDLVLIDSEREPIEGNIVVALVDDDSATLKRYYPDAKHHIVVLHAENDDYEDQEYDLRKHRVIIQGVAINVLKNLL